ncbi:DUF6188 family protein [Streptomyces aurantiogriseus]|uniref:Uncharacterized protein n=1 Tax=Streptomyces aurantiogriseus TaxID=66870 RepID=A0A918FEN4_9ACTN|nr:DUF6188 family protein [Streptomyces aurantiogriseus]GGR30583.1 hypothetical protein GCM10010251_53260 [Streptomyces aurantiogriseus]
MDLNLQGQTVTRVCFDGAFTVLASGGSELRIETEAVLQVPGRRQVSFDPEFPDVVTVHLVALLRDVINVAEVGAVGDLVIEFGSGVKLAVRPHEDYEAWGLVRGDGGRVICMPGGEIALWGRE